MAQRLGAELLPKYYPAVGICRSPWLRQFMQQGDWHWPRKPDSRRSWLNGSAREFARESCGRCGSKGPLVDPILCHLLASNLLPGCAKLTEKKSPMGFPKELFSVFYIEGVRKRASVPRPNFCHSAPESTHIQSDPLRSKRVSQPARRQRYGRKRQSHRSQAR